MLNPIPIISGATGTGKTAVAAALARLIGGEIISADSRQVYRSLDIGTNKSGTWDPEIKTRVYSGVPQFLTDLIDPSESFSAGIFVEHAVRLCRGILSRGKTPVIAGGTGLYIKALVDGLADLPIADADTRKVLKEEMQANGPTYLYDQLKLVDPAAAEKNQKNPQRLLRALEVFRLTGIPLTRLHKSTKKPTNYNFQQFALEWPREELNTALDKRTIEMYNTGLIEETRNALTHGYPQTAPGLEGIGYRHVIQHLGGTLSLAEAITQTQSDTRHYAKRQVTWFRSVPHMHHIPCSHSTFDPTIIAQTIAALLRK